MKKIYTLIISFLISTFAFNVQSQNLQWAFNVGGANNQDAMDVTTDTSGNIITAGSFNGSCDFDPGTGVTTLAALNGNSDGFVAKYDANKTFQWAKKFGSGNTSDDCNAVATDASGNVFIGGDFGDVIDLDPGTGTVSVTAAGFLDGFVVKLDAAGNYLWGFTISGSTGFEEVRALTTDASGNLYVTGYFQGTIDFDPGAGTTNLTCIGSSSDVFFAKYDAAGNLVWAKNIGGSGVAMIPFDITLDAIGSVLLTGSFTGTADFNPATGTANLSAGNQDDIFFAKYDISGNYLWAHNLGNTDFNTPQSIVADANNNVYISGSFYSTIDFNTGTGTANLTSVGQADIYFASYDASGNYRWANRFGSTAPTFDEIGYDLAVTDLGFIYMCGIYRNTIDIDPGATTVNLISNGQTDMFLAKFDALGNYQTAFTIGSTGNDFAEAIALDNSGNIYLAGAFNATCDFDPSSGTTNLTASAADMFLAKYGNGFVGITENNFQNNFILYPNPVRNELAISNLQLAAGDEIKIIDVVGREIYKTQVAFPASSITIETSNLSGGIYFVEMKVQNKKTVRKIIKAE